MAELRRPVIWSSDARVDLSEIWNYYAGLPGNTRQMESCVRSSKPVACLKTISLRGVLAMRFVKVYAPSQRVPTSYSTA
jgi:hypothetical protein